MVFYEKSSCKFLGSGMEKNERLWRGLLVEYGRSFVGVSRCMLDVYI